MRKSFQDKEFIYEDGKFVGINLGWDFAAEHEFGVEGLIEQYKIDKETCHIHAVPKDLIFATVTINGEKCPILISTPFGISKDFFNKDGSVKTKVLPFLDFDTYSFEKSPLMAAWDSKSFAICVKKENKEKLSSVYEALKNKNAKFGFISDGNPYANAGLTILIH